MANGYMPALLLQMKDIAAGNYAGTKQHQTGYLNMLASQPDRPLVIQEAYKEGHRRTATLKYKRRVTEGQISTTETCGPDVVSVYREVDAPISNFVQCAIHIPDDTIRQYELEASRSVNVGLPATKMMQEHYDSLLTAVAALKLKMETVLTTKQNLNWGKNRKTGLNTARAINFNLNGTVNNFNEGLTAVLGDYQLNDQCGAPYIVGNGNFNLFNIQRQANAIGLNQSGINNAALAAQLGYQYYDSPKTQSTWGLNSFGVFSPGSVHLIENQRNVQDFAFDNGIVKKFVLLDPTTSCWTPAGVRPMLWDVKMIYNTCSETYSGGYLGSVAVTEGWNLIISKYYDSFIMPNDMYDGADPLAGNNGTLLMTATNV